MLLLLAVVVWWLQHHHLQHQPAPRYPSIPLFYPPFIPVLTTTRTSPRQLPQPWSAAVSLQCSSLLSPSAPTPPVPAASAEGFSRAQRLRPRPTVVALRDAAQVEGLGRSLLFTSPQQRTRRSRTPLPLKKRSTGINRVGKGQEVLLLLLLLRRRRLQLLLRRFTAHFVIPQHQLVRSFKQL